MGIREKYNSEGYADMTCFLDMRNIERSERKNRMKEDWIYRRGDVYLANLDPHIAEASRPYWDTGDTCMSMEPTVSTDSDTRRSWTAMFVRRVVYCVAEQRAAKATGNTTAALRIVRTVQGEESVSEPVQSGGR